MSPRHQNHSQQQTKLIWMLLCALLFISGLVGYFVVKSLEAKRLKEQGTRSQPPANYQPDKLINSLSGTAY